MRVGAILRAGYRGCVCNYVYVYVVVSAFVCRPPAVNSEHF